MRISRTAVKTFEIEFDFGELIKLEEIEMLTGSSPNEVIARMVELAFEQSQASISHVIDSMIIAGAKDFGNEKRKTENH